MEADNPNIAPIRLHLGDQVISGSARVRDANGVSVTYRLLEGWDAPPGIKGAITPKPDGDGSHAEDFNSTERTIVIEGNIRGPSLNAMEDRIEEIIDAIPHSSDTPLVLYRGGRVRHMMVRNGGEQGLDHPGKELGSGLVIPYSLQLVALDPIKLSGDGSGYTKTGPDMRTAPGVAGSVSWTNAGRGGVPPTLFRITDCTNPVLALGGKTQVFNLTVPADEWLELDFETGSVRLNGTNVYSSMDGRWLPLDKKSNTVNFSADAIGSSGLIDVQTYDSYK